MDHFIWTEPQGALREELADVIATLAQNYDGPVFVPHVTILAPIPDKTTEEMRTYTAQLAEELTPYTLTVDRIAMLDQEHRALFVLYQQTEEALRPGLRAESIVGWKSTQIHMPHLSLYYGNKTEEEKQAMLDTVSADLTQPLLVDRLYLYSSTGTLDSWKKEEEFLLA